MFKVEYTPHAIRALKKLDQQTLAMLRAWIEKNLVGCENPREKGKSLSGSLNNLWRYRIGDYRIIADISDKTVTVLIVNVGHRREIYEN
jgi:mRNA interferase RelE/StbE